MYTSVQAVALFFASFQDALAREQARTTRLFLAGFAAFWLVVVGLLNYFTAPIITREWPDLFIGYISQISGVSVEWSIALVPVLFVTLIMALGLWPYATRRSYQAGANALLSAVAAQDPQVTRRVTSATSDQEDAPEGLTLEGLAHPAGLSGMNGGSIYTVIGCLFFAMYGIMLLQTLTTPYPIHSDPSLGPFSGHVYSISPILFMALSLFPIVFGLVSWWFYSVARWGFTATVDDEGLTMRRARGRPHARRIAWRDVRGFAQVIYYRRRAMPIHAYILDGESERFIWLAPPAPAEAGTLAWDQRDNARRLAALVERHTRLPLLDISDAVSGASGGPSHSTLELSLAERALSVARSSGDHDLARAILERLRPAGPFSRVPRGLARVMVWYSLLSVGSDARARLLVTARALLPYYPYPARPDAPIPQPLPPEAHALRTTWLTLRQAVMIALAITCLLPLMNGLTPSIISRFYSQPLEVAALRRVTSPQPLYFAALTSPTIGWPTRVATSDDPRTAQFTPQGFELSTGQSPTFAQDTFEWNPAIRAPANSAISVTVTVSPAIGGSSDGPAQVTTAGILFDGDASRTHAMLFTVDSLGYWTLERCDSLNNDDFPCPDFLAQGDGSDYGDGPLAPRPGGTTSFHLLVIHQGRTYLFYANGAFLAAYHDDARTAASGGSVGLYLDALGQDARFTNLAVYPAPTGLPFWAQ